MSVAAGWAIDAFIASTLLMAAVLLVRGPVRRAFGPQVAYALWALPVLRLVLPPLPAGWWHAAAAAPVTRAGERFVVLVVEPAATAAAPSIGTVLALVWAGGAALFLGWQIVRHHRFCARILRTAAPVEQCGRVSVVASAAAPGPLAFGVRRRFVAFPADVAARFDADERALALAHELGHHARGDLHANWAALVVLALHWFNPLAWRAFHAFRADQELANDARVLAGCDPRARHAYARAIVKAAAGTRVSLACHLHTIADLKGRLKMLTNSATSRRRVAAGSAAVTLLVAGGLGLTASSSAAERLRSTLKAPIAPVAPFAQTPETPPTPAHAGSKLTRVTVIRDGKTQTYEGAAAAAYVASHPLPGVPTPPAPPAAPDPRQARTIVVHPDGRTAMMLVRRAKVAPGAPLPPDVRLPQGFELPSNCLAGQGGPAQVVKGEKGDASYTILCARAGDHGKGGALAGDERGAYQQALASLHTVRGSIASQATAPGFAESDRRDALAAVDSSIAEIEADLAALK